jgi:hypothetical protein
MNNEAQILGQQGLQIAMDHADRVEPGWNDLAFDMFRDWLSGWPKGYRFRIEQFRHSAAIRGLPDPPSGRAFGGLPRRAKHAGLIIPVDLAKTTSKNQRGCFATVWEKI